MPNVLDDSSSPYYLSKRKRFVFAGGYLAAGAILGYIQVVNDPVPLWVNRALLGLAILPALWAMIRAILPDQEEGFETKLARWRKASDTTLTESLEKVYERLLYVEGSADDRKVRLTVFVPSEDGLRLHQIARYTWDGKRKVNATVIRAGTGVVGITFTHPQKETHRHEIVGEFRRALREVGIEPSEDGHESDRRSFWAIKLWGTDPRKRLGVLAIDSAMRDIGEELKPETEVRTYLESPNYLPKIEGQLQTLLSQR